MTYIPRNKRNLSSNQRQYDPNKSIRFSHKPFQVVHFEDDSHKLEYACDKDGKITLTQTDKKDDSFEQVTVPASLIFALANMLEVTRSVKFQDRIKKDDGSTNS